jgi:protein phosphatase
VTDSRETTVTPDWKETVRYAVISDIGLRRAINQDNLKVVVAESKQSWERWGHLFVVADGMGAHAAGERASELAVDLVPHHYRKSQGPAPAEALHQAISEANAEIFRRGQANIDFRSMGTTCSVLCLLPEGAVVAHVGDSRVYQLRGNQLYQLTFDHSLVWEMQAAGEVTDETARSGVIPKNVITRSLGPNANVEIDIEGPFPIKQGDRYLICSDGLSGQITDEEIGGLMKILDPAEAAQLFVDLSNLRGGPDNITAVVVEIADERITTNQPGAIAVQRRAERKPFSTALGVVTAVCLSLAAIFWFIGLTALAVIVAVLGLIAVATGTAQTVWQGTSADENSRYGNGPYRQYKAVAGQSLFEHLAGTMKSLKEASLERSWDVNWDEFDKRFAQACSRADAKDYEQATAIQANVIIDLMEQIRRQRNGNVSGDSNIDL